MTALTDDRYKYDVAWDAGHGSDTPGKRTPDGYREHWINVKVAYYGMLYLCKRGLSVYKVSWDDMDAKDDADVSLSQRQYLVKTEGCRICISTHANAHGNGKEYTAANGVETFMHEKKSKQRDSEKLARAVQKQLVKGTQQKDRGVKTQNLAMCNCLAMGVEAAVLVEVGFMTNEHEAELMKTDTFCKEQGEDIARGILAYFGIEDNVSTNSQKYQGTFPELPDRGYYQKGDGYRTLQDFSEQIKYLQLFLNWSVDTNLVIDGDYGEQTEKAVASFQEQYGLVVDGLFGTKSLEMAKSIRR